MPDEKKKNESPNRPWCYLINFLLVTCLSLGTRRSHICSHHWPLATTIAIVVGSIYVFDYYVFCGFFGWVYAITYDVRLQRSSTYIRQIQWTERQRRRLKRIVEIIFNALMESTSSTSVCLTWTVRNESSILIQRITQHSLLLPSLTISRQTDSARPHENSINRG